MPEKRIVEQATRDKREGKSPSTQAGNFVREEMHHIREGKHGARSAKQAIAIGLSKARRSGVALKAPAKGAASAETRRNAERDAQHGRSKKKTSAARSRATRQALQKEGTAAASTSALQRQTRAAARRRGAGELSAAARKAAATKKRTNAGADRA